MTNSRFSSLLKLFALTGLLMLITSSAHAWRVQLPGGSRAETVVVDAAGDVIAAGRAFYGGELIKLSGATGELIWQFNASHNQTEQGVGSIALDSRGDVFVLIGIQRSVTKISGATGQRIWTGIIGGSIGGCQNRFNSIAVDRDDNVVAAGTAGCLFSVAKLDGVTGDERWHYECDGLAYAVAVDPFGDVSAAGLMNLNFGTVKLRGTDGSQLWRKEINGAGNTTNVHGSEQANAVAMDQDGSVVAVGSTSNEFGNPRDFTVVKYLADGTTDWIQIIDGFFRVTLTGDDASDDTANAVVIDKDGSVIAAGFVQESLDIPRGPEPEHFHVIKISRNGSVVWSKPAEDLIPAPPGEPEYISGRGFSLSVNAFGNIVAGGVHGDRFTLVKFWGRTGGRAWRRQIVATDPSDLGQAIRVSMDAASDVIAVGEMTSQSTGASSQFTVVKLNRKDGLDYTGGPPDNVPDVVVEHAPYVYLYSDDQYRPGNPLTFINNSSLGWSHANGCTDYPAAPLSQVQPERLGLNGGTRPYSHHPLLPLFPGDCFDYLEVTFKATDHTRPYDSDRDEDNGTPYSDIWSNSFYEREGFYLDLDDNNQNLRNGRPSELGNPIYPGAPVFYELVEQEHKYIIYWFFYPYDSFAAAGIDLQEHEGDWERIAVQLDDNEVPVKVFFYQHDDVLPRDWNTIELYDDTHPVVLSAKGSHASYPAACVPGVRCSGELRDHGPAWLTWNDLSNVRAQPWYGFGGAWGAVGDGIRGHFGGFYTGPLGPSKFKKLKITEDEFLSPSKALSVDRNSKSQALKELTKALRQQVEP